MNTYKITFTRENGTTGSDRFTAATEAQAKKDFNEVYRHGNGTITSIELVSTDAPATKDQERKALEKIRKIVAELGPQSYLATAFEGAFEDAESNIDNDFGDSMKRRWEHTEQQLKAAKEEIASLKDALSESEKDYEAAHAAAHDVADQKDAEIEKLKAENQQLRETGRWNGDQTEQARADAEKEQLRADAAEAKVIELKAKLYDYMTAGA